MSIFWENLLIVSSIATTSITYFKVYGKTFVGFNVTRYCHLNQMTNNYQLVNQVTWPGIDKYKYCRTRVNIKTKKWIIHLTKGNICNEIVTVVGNGHDDPSSKPGRRCLHFTFSLEYHELTYILLNNMSIFIFSSFSPFYFFHKFSIHDFIIFRYIP